MSAVNFCFIADGAIIDESMGPVRLGVSASIGNNSVVMSGATVGAGAFIGPGCVIYPGVTIGDGAVVDPGCVVKSNIPAYSHVTCQGAIATGPTKDLGAVVQDLHDYAKTHDKDIVARRWDIVERLRKYINSMGIDEWCQLYEMALVMLWEGGDESSLIRRNFIDPAIAHFEPSPMGNEGSRVAWLIKHAAGGSYTPFAMAAEYLRWSPPSDVYVHGSARDKEVKLISDMGHEVMHFGGSMGQRIDGIRLTCHDRGVGTLICDAPTAIPTALYLLRAAPKQVYLSSGFTGMPCDSIVMVDNMVMEEIDKPFPWFAMGRAIGPKTEKESKAAARALYAL